MNKFIPWIEVQYKALPTWAQGIVTAAEAGAAGFLMQWAVSAQPLCLNRDCLRQFGAAFVAAVVISIRNWLKQSPIVKTAV